MTYNTWVSSAYVTTYLLYGAGHFTKAVAPMFDTETSYKCTLDWSSTTLPDFLFCLKLKIQWAKYRLSVEIHTAQLHKQLRCVPATVKNDTHHLNADNRQSHLMILQESKHVDPGLVDSTCGIFVQLSNARGRTSFTSPQYLCIRTHATRIVQGAVDRRQWHLVKSVPR
jgi:hypothetical protein